MAVARALSAVAFGGKEQRGMAMGFPLLAQQRQGALGQRDVTIPVALAGADVQEHPFGINVADWPAQALRPDAGRRNK